MTVSGFADIFFLTFLKYAVTELCVFTKFRFIGVETQSFINRYSLPAPIGESFYRESIIQERWIPASAGRTTSLVLKAKGNY